MNARSKLILAVAVCGLAGVSGCAPSILYVRSGAIGTHGEIPRDGRGEPLWSAIRQGQPQPPMPDMPDSAGIPITPPQP